MSWGHPFFCEQSLLESPNDSIEGSQIALPWQNCPLTLQNNRSLIILQILSSAQQNDCCLLRPDSPARLPEQLEPEPRSHQGWHQVAHLSGNRAALPQLQLGFCFCPGTVFAIAQSGQNARLRRLLLLQSGQSQEVTGESISVD